MSKPKNQPAAPATPAAVPAVSSNTTIRKVRVRATKVGFYKDSMVKKGTVFFFRYDTTTRWPSWMEEIDDDNNPISGAVLVPPMTGDMPIVHTDDAPAAKPSDEVI